jgi:galactose oxidase
MNQSLMFLNGFRQNGTTLTIPAPANANLAPPGHYMLFVLNARGVPSVARIIRISSSPTRSSEPDTDTPYITYTETTSEPTPSAQPTLAEHSEKIIAKQDRPPIAIGLTPACPYGLGPCWGGAYDALRNISDIETVNPVPDQADSVAFVYPKERDCLPDIEVWREEVKRIVNNSYELRGIEMTLSGAVTKKGDELVVVTEGGKSVALAPFTQASQLKWDIAAEGPRAVSDVEAAAWKRLSEAVAQRSAGGELHMKVTGTLQKACDRAFSLDVRKFEVVDGPE